MTPERWAAIKSIFDEVSNSGSSDQAALLDRLCREDAEMRAEVTRLLDADRRAATFLDSPALLLSPDSSQQTTELESMVGRRVGPYSVVREIGRGGMGTVYLAERADAEFDQRVALKLVREARSERVLRWFRYERQILASLEHPNIARLLDGGTTEDGIPYLVMEYVEGTPIDEYCTARKLSIDERLALFRQVCAAVDFAHRRLVVHRDLKPRNILVANGIPKLLDFGIAKLLSPDGSDDAADTRQRVLTPEYASPEQIRGEPIRPANDVFALGVLLYRLLTDKGPYGSPTPPPYELARAVCEQEPDEPSAAVDDRGLRRRLKGELDTIAMTALRKDPERRYASVAQLDEDIDRHLTGRPILAHDGAFTYRARKFVVRHRFAVASATAVVVALVGGLAATMWQAHQTELQRARAERRFAEVRQLANSLIFEVHDGIENLPGATPTRQLLVKRALDYFDSLAAEERNDPALQRELASAYDKLGGVLGRPYASNMGDSEAALASYQKALNIREALARDAADRQTRLDLWSSYFNVGQIHRETSNTRAALEYHAKAYDIVSGLVKAQPDDPDLLRALARTAVTRAHTFEQAGRVSESLATAREALALHERLLKADPASRAGRSELATDIGRVGIALLRLGNEVDALRHAERRIGIARELTAADPANVAYRRGLSTAHLQLGQALTRNGDVAGAVREQRAALDIRRALSKEDPADRQASIDVMFAELELGQVLARNGDRAAAAEALQSASATAQKLAASDPKYVFYRLSLASALTHLSQVLSQAGRHADAAAHARRAIATIESVAARDAADTRLRFATALAYEAMGDALSGERVHDPVRVSGGSRDSAQDWYRRSVEMMTAMQKEGVLAGGTLFGDEHARLAAVAAKSRKAPVDSR
jgi:non-specific serine/threonine protein kinase/serine/threonine-protein kinase